MWCVQWIWNGAKAKDGKLSPGVSFFISFVEIRHFPMFMPKLCSLISDWWIHGWVPKLSSSEYIFYGKKLCYCAGKWYVKPLSLIFYWISGWLYYINSVIDFSVSKCCMAPRIYFRSSCDQSSLSYLCTRSSLLVPKLHMFSLLFVVSLKWHEYSHICRPCL
jgi:hypothetical protein